MVQKHIVISMIAPVTVAGILIMAILAAISSTNQTFAYSSYHKAYYKGHHGYYKSSKYTKREGNIRASKSVTTANAAQGASNTGNEQGVSNTGNEHGVTSTANTQQECKPTITLNVSPATTGASSYQLKGRLTCGGSGLGGKTITLTRTHVSYFGRMATPVTGPDGTFSATVPGVGGLPARPLTEASAWYIPSSGGMASKAITLTGGTPQGATNANAAQGATNANAAQGGNNANAAQGGNNANAAQGGNNGNAVQGASNTGQGAPSSQAGHCKSAITQLSATYYQPYKNWRISGELTCGGSGLSGKTIILTNSKLSYVGKLGTVVTGVTGLGGGGFFVTSSIKPTATTAKPGSTLSAWYLGGPDEGGIASKIITLPLLTAFTKPTPLTGEEKEASNGNVAQGGNNGNTP